MTMMEQKKVAEQTKAFLSQWGLKHKFVAEKCKIPGTVFSSFIHGRLALSDRQLSRIEQYTSDYLRRNS